MMRILFLYVICACALPGFAQSAPDGGSGQRLIQLNLAATNARGEPVTDLQLSDIQLREDGKPRPLVFLRFDGSGRAMVPAAPGEFSNHPTPAPLVILLDRWNDRLTMAARAWIELGAAVQRLESVESVYIYFLTNQGDLFPVHPLPAAGENLRATAQPSPAELRAKLDDAVQKFQGFRARDDLNVRLKTTFQALDALRAKMDIIAGRKNLIWVTQGIPLTFRTPSGPIDISPQVRSLSERTAQDQIAVYPVDQSFSVGGELSRTLQLYSALTGGRWFPDNDAGRAFAEAATDARASYRIGYYSTAPEKEGKQHKIRVDTERKGIHLLTRDAFTDAGGPTPDQLEIAKLNNQTSSPVDATEIGLRVAMTRKTAGMVHFDIHLNPADVLMQESGGRYRLKLDVLLALYSDGVLKGTSPATRMDLSLSQEQLDQAAKVGITVPLDATVSDQIQQFRVVVFDTALQALGSVTIPAK